MPEQICLEHAQRLARIEEVNLRQEDVIRHLIDKIDDVVGYTLEIKYTLDNGFGVRVAAVMEKQSRRRRRITTLAISVAVLGLAILQFALTKGWI